MKKSNALGPGLSRKESLWGFGYFLLQLILLPEILFWVNGQLHPPISDSELNFVFYLSNFLTVLLIFSDFWRQSIGQLLHRKVDTLQAVILGLVGYFACRQLVTVLIPLLSPGFRNLNDDAIGSLSRSNFFLIGLGTVVLVPPAEECFFRVLIFRQLWDRSRFGAYTVSILAFTAVHVLGYLGRYSALDLFLTFLQYLPAGLFLAWSYTKAGTIFAPIIIHALINLNTISSMR